MEMSESPSDPTDAFTVDPALAASMGFTSFGSAPRPAKRMRYTDNAFTENSKGRGGRNKVARIAGTGANTVAVGVRRGKSEVEETGRNEDEIELDLDFEDGDVQMGDGMDMDMAVSKDAGVVEVEKEDGTGEVVMQESSTTPLSAQPSSKQKHKHKPKPPATGLASFLQRGQTIKPPAPNPSLPSLPPTPPQPSNESNEPTISLPHHAAPHQHQNQNLTSESIPSRFADLTPAHLAQLRRGVPDERGDLAIFMPSFVEDPWARLYGGY